MAGCKDPFLAVCLSLSGDRRWSDALFSYAGSKSTVFWAKDAFLKLLDSRSTGIVLTLFSIGSRHTAYGLRLGGFMQQFQGDRFINGMSLALLCLFCLLFPTVLGDDMARRGF